jgi:hypothetical protein
MIKVFMKGLKSISVIFVFFLCSFSISENKTKINYNIDPKYKQAKTDNLGNIYYIYEKKIIKIDMSGEREYVYSNPLLGTIESVDVLNPLRIMIFHKETNHIQFLSKFLEETGKPINLSDIGIYNAEIVVNSNHNGFWIYEKSSDKLLFFDNNLKKRYQTPSFRSLKYNSEIIQIIAGSSKTVVNTGNGTIFFFDNLGNFISKKHYLLDFIWQINNNEIIYSYKNFLLKSADKSLVQDTVHKFKDIKSEIFDIQNNNLFIFRKDSLITKKIY